VISGAAGALAPPLIASASLRAGGEAASLRIGRGGGRGISAAELAVRVTRGGKGTLAGKAALRGGVSRWTAAALPGGVRRWMVAASCTFAAGGR
jgi:hypothetical protein